MTNSSSVKRLLLHLQQVYTQRLLLDHQTVLLSQFIQEFRIKLKNNQAKTKPLRTLKDKNLTVMRSPYVWYPFHLLIFDLI